MPLLIQVGTIGEKNMSKLEEFLEQVKKNNPDQQKTVLLEMVETLMESWDKDFDPDDSIMWVLRTKEKLNSLIPSNKNNVP